MRIAALLVHVFIWGFKSYGYRMSRSQHDSVARFRRIVQCICAECMRVVTWQLHVCRHDVAGHLIVSTRVAAVAQNHTSTRVVGRVTKERVL